jgi:glyoxylase-like metal-dependent hydrolase (beta-lactamase superfamily II)
LDPIPLHAFNPGPITGDGNWTWLLRGHVPTLIDAGTGDPRHIEALLQALDGTPLAQVLVTHSHADHASGAVVLSARLPGARFRKLPWPGRDTRWPVPWEPIADGDVIAAGDTTLVAVHTPGHSPDHVVFWHPPSRSMFGGDLAIDGSTVWIPSSLQGDLKDYLASLDRALALRPERMYPAHGPVIERPRDLLARYIAHRLERERQVLDALGHGDTLPDAMVLRIYADLEESRRPMARDSVLSHLVKLERDGRVRRDGEAWHLHPDARSQSVP